MAELNAPFVEMMRTRFRVEHTLAFAELAEQSKNKIVEARVQLEGDLILERWETLSAAMYSGRHMLAGYFIHGFHHQLSNRENCHYPENSCTCKYCWTRLSAIPWYVLRNV